jgi:hypothetical protein
MGFMKALHWCSTDRLLYLKDLEYHRDLAKKVNAEMD